MSEDWLFIPDGQIQHRLLSLLRGQVGPGMVFLRLYLSCSPVERSLGQQAGLQEHGEPGKHLSPVLNTRLESFAFPRNREFNHILLLFQRTKSLPKDLTLIQVAQQTDLQWVKGKAVSPHHLKMEINVAQLFYRSVICWKKITKVLVTWSGFPRVS